MSSECNNEDILYYLQLIVKTCYTCSFIMAAFGTAHMPYCLSRGRADRIQSLAYPLAERNFGHQHHAVNQYTVQRSRSRLERHVQVYVY